MKTRNLSLALSLGTAAAIFAGSALASPGNAAHSPFSAEKIEVSPTAGADGKCGANKDGKCGAKPEAKCGANKDGKCGAKPSDKPKAGNAAPPAAKPIVKPKPKYGKKKHKAKRQHKAKSHNRR